MWYVTDKKVIRKSNGNYSSLSENKDGDLIMTKSWRPDGWGNPYYEQGEGGYGGAIYFTEDAFEAGADAMLEALRKKGQPNFLAFLRHCVNIVPEVTIGKGKYFFIPDDE